MVFCGHRYANALQSEIIFILKLSGHFGQFLNIQLASQTTSQTVKLGTAAFPAQQLFLHNSFPCTASQPQPKQTGPYSCRTNLIVDHPKYRRG
jgi:hypothetical protein